MIIMMLMTMRIIAPIIYAICHVKLIAITSASTTTALNPEASGRFVEGFVWRHGSRASTIVQAAVMTTSQNTI